MLLKVSGMQALVPLKLVLGSGVSQIKYSLVMILELNSVLEVQYKDMMIDR